MEEDAFGQQQAITKCSKKQVTNPSTDKSVRIMLLAILLQIAAQTRLTGEEIFEQIPFYGQNPQKALYRDLKTLSGELVENLPNPGNEHLDEWCAEQQRRGRLAITYDRDAGTFIAMLGRSSERGDCEETIIGLVMQASRKSRINLGNDIQRKAHAFDDLCLWAT